MPDDSTYDINLKVTADTAGAQEAQDAVTAARAEATDVTLEGEGALEGLVQAAGGVALAADADSIVIGDIAKAEQTGALETGQPRSEKEDEAPESAQSAAQQRKLQDLELRHKEAEETTITTPGSTPEQIAAGKKTGQVTESQEAAGEGAQQQKAGGPLDQQAGGVAPGEAGQAFVSYGDRINKAAEELGKGGRRDALGAALQHVVEAVENHARTLTKLNGKQQQRDQRLEAQARRLGALVKNQRT